MTTSIVRLGVVLQYILAIYYLEDPLWDGKGCGRYSSCCEGEGKPWFFKDLSQSVTSDIEVRVCCDAPRHRIYIEYVLIEIISLYVQ